MLISFYLRLIIYKGILSNGSMESIVEKKMFLEALKISYSFHKKKISAKTIKGSCFLNKFIKQINHS